MTGEWEEKKGQKQTDRWSGKVMQLKRGGIPHGGNTLTYPVGRPQHSEFEKYSSARNA